MFEVSKKVTIYQKENNSGFAKVNRVQLALSYDGRDKIGSSIGAVNKMLERSEELKVLMPTMLGVSPTDNTWMKTVNDYWNSLSVPVPDNTGLPLEIGFRFDVNDSSKSEAIKALAAKMELKGEEAIGTFVLKGNLEETEKYRYATPINVANYLLWRYCLNYRDVANRIEDINKSPHIRFYIHDELVRIEAEEKAFKLKSKAETKFYEVLPDKTKVESLLTVFGHNVLAFKNEISKHKTLRSIVDNKPSDFLAAEADKRLLQKAFIEKCIVLGILKRYPNTTAVIDTDTNDTLGLSLDAAILYLDDVKHKDVLTRLQTKCVTKEKEYNALPQ